MKKLSVLCFGIIFVLAGCATAPKRPDWITKGGAAFKGDKKVLYGVGVADNISSESLRRETADNRAIAEISKQITVMSTSMMRDYQASTAATTQEKSSGEQYVENTVKTFASNTVSGIKVVDRWDDGKKTYSLAELNIDDLKSLADKVNELSSSVKEYIKANAEKAFDKLDQEQTKQAK